MGKKILLIVISLLLLSGCVIERVDNKSISDIEDIILSENITYTNVNYKGYSYYLPIGMNKSGNEEYNELLYSKYNDYYLYVDIVSYYNNINIEYDNNLDDEPYYSKELEYGDKKGYIVINKVDGLFFVEMMYNYAKIEAMINETDINDTIINGLTILNSVTYNDVIIDSLIGTGAEELEKESYNILKPKGQESNFLDYLEEYDKYEEIDDDASITNDEELQIIE